MTECSQNIVQTPQKGQPLHNCPIKNCEAGDQAVFICLSLPVTGIRWLDKQQAEESWHFRKREKL